jgi:hypothetical protein
MSQELQLPSYGTIFKRKFAIILAGIVIARVVAKLLGADSLDSLLSWMKDGWAGEALWSFILASGMTAAYAYDRWIDPPELRRTDRYVP